MKKLIILSMFVAAFLMGCGSTPTKPAASFSLPASAQFTEPTPHVSDGPQRVEKIEALIVYLNNITELSLKNKKILKSTVEQQSEENHKKACAAINDMDNIKTTLYEIKQKEKILDAISNEMNSAQLERFNIIKSLIVQLNPEGPYCT